MVVRPFFYTFVPTKRERVCFQSVVRRVVKRQSKYCYKNATQPIVRIGIGLKYNDIGEVGSQTSLSAKISVTSCKTTSCADFSFKGAPNLRQNFLGN